MLKLLVDTNVILDVVLKRGQPGIDGARLLSALQSHHADGYIAAHAITTIYYFIAKRTDDATARLAVVYVLQLLSVVPLTGADFHAAVALGMADFEDSVHAAAALAVQADYIVTGNRKEFRHSPVPPRSAAEILPLVLGSNER
ncbi:MAG TPA: PIN domain-containing protein [Gemmatimonadaceae bacterium]|jgi:predicted nucleic acid-binding protein